MAEESSLAGLEVPEKTRHALARWIFSPLQGVLLFDWLRLLQSHGLTVPPKYWPRVVFALGMGCLNSVLRWFEEFRFGNEINRMKVKAPVFVLGHHRSGTTHLWNLMTVDDRFAFPTVLQAVFPHTFLLFQSIARWGATRLSIRKRPQDNVKFHPDGPVEEERALCTTTFQSVQMIRHFPRARRRYERFLTMRETTPPEKHRWKQAFLRFAQKLVLKHGADKTLVFKAPDHTGKIRLLLEQFPDARFVHIHRDPYVVYRSTLKMERTTLPIYAFQDFPQDELEPYVLWRYRSMYKAFEEDVKLIPEGQFSEVSFEELERAPFETIKKIYQELNLPDFGHVAPRLQETLDGLRGYRKNTYQTLDEDTRERVHNAWKASFERWDYAV